MRYRRCPHDPRTFSAPILLLLALLAAACAPPEPGGETDSEGATRTFEVRYESVIREVPASAETAYLWIPYPTDTADQKILEVQVETSLAHDVLTEKKYGNKTLRVTVPPGTAEDRIALVFRVERRERLREPGNGNGSVENGRSDKPSLWLAPDRRIPLDGRIRAMASELVDGMTTPLEKARAIYDYTVSSMSYDKSGEGWGNGDIYWACDAKRGNCTDFHAMFIGFNRALQIPARFEMGFPIPVERGEGEIGGYHCWAQFHLADDGWIPVDASEAKKNPDKREYFFGAHDENRVVLSYGRDLVLPGMQADPLNYFIYPYAEVDGRPHASVERKFTYRDLDVASS